MKWIGLAILSLIAILGAISQTLPSILVEPSKAALGMTDTTIGLINGLGVSLIGAMAAFPIGWAADRYGRRLVLGVSVVVWSAFVLVTGLATSVTLFAVGAIGINLGDAALLPLLYAMIAATFTGQARNTANGLFVAVLLLGSFGVYSVGGGLLRYFAHTPLWELAPWRAVCVTIAIAGAVAVLLLLLVPQGHRQPPVISGDPLQEEGFVSYFKREGGLIVVLFLSISVFYTAYGSLMFWAPAILERQFAMTTDAANLALGAPLVAASGLGVVVTLGGQRFLTSLWGDAAAYRTLLVGCVLMILPTSGLLFADTREQFMALITCIAFAMTIAMMLAPGFMQSCAPDRFRSRTIALFPIVALVMRAGMPALIGVLSDKSAHASGALLAIVGGVLLTSLCVSILSMLALQRRYLSLVARVRAAGD